MISSALRQPETWRPLVTALRQSAPAGTREIEFRGTVFHGSMGGSVVYDGDPSIRAVDLDRGERPIDTLRPIRDLVAVEGIAVRVFAPAEGEARVSIVPGGQPVSFGMGAELLEVVLLVAGAVPEPYRREPVRLAEAVASPLADPSAVTELVRRHLPDAEPVSLEALAEAESSLGMALPDDVRALYLAANSGDLIVGSEDNSDFYGMRIVPLLDQDYRSTLEPAARFLSWQYGATEVAAADPAERVQALAVSRDWFILGDDWGGNLYVADLAPGPRGHIGQILFVDHEMSSGASWVAPSLTELLTQRPREMTPPATPQELLVRVGPRSGRTLADVRPSTEVLYVSPAPEPAALSVLAGHDSLRTLVTQSSAIASLSDVMRLPRLEFLELDVNGWLILLRAGQVPRTLLAAGLSGRGDWDATVEVVNGLLGSWGHPQLDLAEVHLT
jgi:cell wall assembly regulator SMI1